MYNVLMLKERLNQQDNTQFHVDRDVNLFILLDQTRDLIAKARALELKHANLTPQQVRILYSLYKNRDGRTIDELAILTLKERSTTIAITGRMVKNGLIEKLHSIENRKIRFVITKKGLQRYNIASFIAWKMIFSVLNEDEREQLIINLKKLHSRGREVLGMDFVPPLLQSIVTSEPTVEDAGL
jgi:DNA-binding MarR family transcriptional regulator